MVAEACALIHDKILSPLCQVVSRQSGLMSRCLFFPAPVSCYSLGNLQTHFRVGRLPAGCLAGFLLRQRPLLARTTSVLSLPLAPPPPNLPLQALPPSPSLRVCRAAAALAQLDLPLVPPNPKILRTVLPFSWAWLLQAGPSWVHGPQDPRPLPT